MKKLQYDVENLASLDVDKYVRKAAGKCEENVKIKIVIPLLELLDFNPQQDMDFEHHVQNKKADIALLFDNRPKLFVETKDLDEDLDNHIHQALDYAFNKGVEWVILTNGLEIRVYKSFIPYIPSEDRLIFTTTLSNLPQSFNAIFELVGKEHLQEGKKLTEKAESIRENITTKILIEDLAECRKRLANDLFVQFKARYETDSEFKEIIDTWATAVKMNISDPGLIEKLCREGAYTLINRVLFLRICEDKGHIKAKLSKNAIAKWREMVEDPSKMLGMAFEEIGESFEGLYKSPLFDSINFEDIEWNADTINFVLDKLGEHDFSKISKDILGRAYEQHISRKERKELGQFYTPDFVIDYILDQVEISPEKKILDPACGSGGFLMKAYDRLRRQYLEEDLAESIVHEQALKNNLYGIDINPFATQLTVMNLLLKDLDHPPSIVNVVEGDSLDKTFDGLDMDILYKDEPLAKVTAGEKKVSLVTLLRNRPFDIVVGNPPYGDVLSQKNKATLKKQYESWKGTSDIYCFFVERGVDLLKETGVLGFILPSTFLVGPKYSALRNFILRNTSIVVILDMRRVKVFDSAEVFNAILVLRKCSNRIARDTNKVRYVTGATITDSQIHIIEEQVITQSDLEDREWVPEDAILGKIRLSTRLTLGDIADCRDAGIKYQYTGVGKERGRKQRKSLAKVIYYEGKKLHADDKPYLKGSEISRYVIKRENLRNKWFRHDYGDFIHRELGEVVYFNPRYFVVPKKILSRQTADRIIAIIDSEQLYVANTLHVTILKPQHEKDFYYEYVLAVMNSKVSAYFYRGISQEKGRTFAQVKLERLKKLPIFPATKEVQKEFVQLVDKILSLNKQLSDLTFAEQQEVIRKEIDATDIQIDEKVFDLYGLTEEEKEIIRGASPPLPASTQYRRVD